MATKAPAKKSAPKKPVEKVERPKPVGMVKPHIVPRSKTMQNGEPRPKSRRK